MANSRQPLPGAIKTLPDDIIFLILKSLDSFPTLHSLILTSSVFNNVFNKYPNSIAKSIIFTCFPPEALRVLNLCRPPYCDANLPGRPEPAEIYSGVLTKKIPPPPLISPFARRFLRGTKSTEHVPSKISKIDYDLSPDPHFFGYWEARRLCINAGTVKDMIMDFVERFSALEILEARMVSAFGQNDHGYFERAIYNMYLLGGSVYSTLPFEMQHFKQVDVSGFDSLWVIDVPYMVVGLMEFIVKHFGIHIGLNWDLATRFRETLCLDFARMERIAMTTQILTADVLALQGESKPYGHETSREELKERVELLRALMEKDADTAPMGSYKYIGELQQINWAWLAVDIDENHKREVLFINGPHVGSSLTAESTLQALRHKYTRARELSKDCTRFVFYYNLLVCFSVDTLQLQAWRSLSHLDVVLGEFIKVFQW